MEPEQEPQPQPLQPYIQTSLLSYTVYPQSFQHRTADGGDDYVYDRGIFTQSKVPFIIDDRQRYSRESYRAMWPTLHRNLLGCYLLDNERRLVLLEEFDCTLASKFRNLRNSNIFPLMHRPMPVIKGVYLPYTPIFFVPEDYRRIFRDIVTFLEHLHSDGHCAGEYNMANLVVKDNKVKFVGLTLSVAGEAGIAADFYRLHQIVASIYQPLEAMLPPDFRAWMNSLFSYNHRLLNGMLKVSVATLSDPERLSYITEIHDRGPEIGRLHGAAVSVIKQPKGKVAWPSRIQSFYEGPLFLCYKRENVYDKRRPRVVIGNGYVSRGLQPHQMLRFCRNFAVHGKQYHGRLDPSTPMNDGFIGDALFSIFGEELSEYQVLAHNRRFPSGKTLLSCYKYCYQMN